MNSKGSVRMATSAAKLKGNKKHQDQLDRLIIQPYKLEGEQIREAASKAGMSVQGFILAAVREYMESNRGV